MNERAEAIARRITEAIRDNSMQQKEVADAIGVAYTTFNSWMRRVSSINADYIVPIAKYLGVSATWILTGEEVEVKEVPDSYVDLNPNEMFLIKTFRALDQEGQVVVANKAVEELRRVRAEQGNAATDTQSA